MKRRVLDQLTRDALAARAAGMTYGKWKAGYPPVLLTPEEPQKMCARCGKPVSFRMTGKGGSTRKYCLDCVARPLTSPGKVVES